MNPPLKNPAYAPYYNNPIADFYQYNLMCFLSTSFLQIFTEDMAEVENLPRFKVLSHIKSHAPRLVMAYMVSISHELGLQPFWGHFVL